MKTVIQHHEISLFAPREAISFDCCHASHTLSIKKADDCGIRVYPQYKLSILMTDGLAAVVGNNILKPVRADILFFRPDEIHHGRFLRSGEHCYIDFLIPDGYEDIFSRGSHNLFLPLCDKSAERINMLCPTDSVRAEILRIGKRLQELALDRPIDEIAVFAYLAELLDISYPIYLEQRTNRIATPIPAVVRQVIELLNSRFCDSTLSLEFLSATFGCSITYLTRTFRQHTGSSIHEYLTERRIDHAKSLLTSGLSVTEVCYACGFGDCSNFIKCFRHYVGVTPHKFV